MQYASICAPLSAFLIVIVVLFLLKTFISFNPEQIPFSIAEDKGLQQEFFARLFCGKHLYNTLWIDL